MAAQRVQARPRVGFAVTHAVPIAGPEDITIDQAAGRASIVAQDRWSTKENTQLPGIYVLDLTSDTALPERLSSDLSGDFKGSVRGLAAISMLCTLAGTRDLPFPSSHRLEGLSTVGTAALATWKCGRQNCRALLIDA